MSRHSQAYADGYSARGNGESSLANPHSQLSDNDQYEDWLDGWVTRDLEMLDDRADRIEQDRAE